MPSGCVQEAPMAPNEMTHHPHCREPHSNSCLPQLFVIDLKSLRHLPYAESPYSMSLCRMSQQYLSWDRIERNVQNTYIHKKKLTDLPSGTDEWCFGSFTQPFSESQQVQWIYYLYFREELCCWQELFSCCMWGLKALVILSLCGLLRFVPFSY